MDTCYAYTIVRCPYIFFIRFSARLMQMHSAMKTCVRLNALSEMYATPKSPSTSYKWKSDLRPVVMIPVFLYVPISSTMEQLQFKDQPLWSQLCSKLSIRWVPLSGSFLGSYFLQWLEKDFLVYFRRRVLQTASRRRKTGQWLLKKPGMVCIIQ